MAAKAQGTGRRLGRPAFAPVASDGPQRPKHRGRRSFAPGAVFTRRPALPSPLGKAAEATRSDVRSTPAPRSRSRPKSGVTPCSRALAGKRTAGGAARSAAGERRACEPAAALQPVTDRAEPAREAEQARRPFANVHLRTVPRRCRPRGSCQASTGVRSGLAAGWSAASSSGLRRGGLI